MCTSGVPTRGRRSRFPGTTIDRAVVVTVTVAFTAVVPLSVRDVGLSVQFEDSVVSVHASATVPVKP